MKEKQMKKPFEVGDKIKFVGPTWKYNSGGNSAHSWEHTPQAGEVKSVAPDRLAVTAFGGKTIMIHPRQVTHRIVKKKRREFWIEFYPGCDPTIYDRCPEVISEMSKLIHVVEVRK